MLLSQIQKALFAQWAHHWANDDEDEKQRVNDLLKATGVHAYEWNGLFPTLYIYYNGEIRTGMLFSVENARRTHMGFYRVTRIANEANEGVRVWLMPEHGPQNEVWCAVGEFRAHARPHFL